MFYNSVLSAHCSHHLEFECSVWLEKTVCTVAAHGPNLKCWGRDGRCIYKSHRQDIICIAKNQCACIISIFHSKCSIFITSTRVCVSDCWLFVHISKNILSNNNQVILHILRVYHALHPSISGCKSCHYSQGTAFKIPAAFYISVFSIFQSASESNFITTAKI